MKIEHTNFTEYLVSEQGLTLQQLKVNGLMLVKNVPLISASICVHVLQDTS